MSKRFTDTNKWEKPWFSSLPQKAKITWIYLLDRCDHAGLWPSNFNLASFHLGFNIVQKDFDEWFAEKVIKIDETKHFIRSFIEFQYGDSSKEFKARVSAFKILEKNGLLDEFGSLREDLGKCSEQLPNCPSISISISKSKSKSKKENELIFKITNQAFEEIYKNYPRKEGKSKGFEIAKREIKTEKDLQDLRQAIQNYKSVLTDKGTDSKYVKMFSTFMSSWRDCLDPDFGKAQVGESVSDRIKKMYEENPIG